MRLVTAWTLSQTWRPQLTKAQRLEVGRAPMSSSQAALQELVACLKVTCSLSTCRLLQRSQRVAKSGVRPSEQHRRYTSQQPHDPSGIPMRLPALSSHVLGCFHHPWRIPTSKKATCRRALQNSLQTVHSTAQDWRKQMLPATEAHPKDNHRERSSLDRMRRQYWQHLVETTEERELRAAPCRKMIAHGIGMWRQAFGACCKAQA